MTLAFFVGLKFVSIKDTLHKNNIVSRSAVRSVMLQEVHLTVGKGLQFVKQCVTKEVGMEIHNFVWNHI